ncbi:hypothetical protein [Paraburkholderia diazotrophica]|uniref:hypothetical protein n=1 Tax=Paraburkholderia diazotrophica TaxID=667676 RepID=UPI00115F8FC7|nr:hypothetical protein [Paraburkholderia diazotrophica]
MQHEHGIDTKVQASSGHNRGTEQSLKAREAARNWSWAEAGEHYDWMDDHLPFENDTSLNGF